MSSQQGCGLADVQGSEPCVTSAEGLGTFVSPSLEWHPRQDTEQTTPNEVGYHHDSQHYCALAAAPQLGCEMVNGALTGKSRPLYVRPSVFVPPPRGLHCREILIYDRVGRFDSPVTRRAGTLAGTSSLSCCGGRHCAVLALGNVLFERSPKAKDMHSSMRKCPPREVSNWRSATRSGRPHMARGTKS